MFDTANSSWFLSSFLTSFYPFARGLLRGYEAMNMIRKGQIKGVEKGNILGQVEFVSKIFQLLHNKSLSIGKLCP